MQLAIRSGEKKTRHLPMGETGTVDVEKNGAAGFFIRPGLRAWRRGEYDRTEQNHSPRQKCHRLLSYVLVPKLRLGRDEFMHQLDAGGILAYFHVDSLRAHVFLRTPESFVFADDDLRDSVEQDGAAAHGTRRQRRIDGAATVYGRRQAARVFQTVHFRMVDHAGVLHAAVVTTADDLSVENQDRTDGNPSFGASRAGFFDGGFHEGVRGSHGQEPR